MLVLYFATPFSMPGRSTSRKYKGSCKKSVHSNRRNPLLFDVMYSLVHFIFCRTFFILVQSVIYDPKRIESIVEI